MSDVAWTKNVESLPLTKNQRRWVGYIRDQYLARKHGKANVDNYEFKTFEGVMGAGGSVALRIESGLKTDANTAAEILCRYTYLVFIGPRGGLTVHNNSFGHAKDKPKKGRAAKWELI